MRPISKNLVLFLVVLFSLCHKSSAQQSNNETFANKVNNAIEQLTEGQLVLHIRYKKVSVGEDSLKIEEQYNCTFRQLSADSLLGYQFKTFITGKDSGYMYDGTNLWYQYTTGLETSTKAEDAKHIKQVAQNLYPLFASINDNSFKFLKKHNKWGDMTILGLIPYKGELCYKVNVKALGQNGVKVTRNIYIAKKTFIPIAEVRRFDQIIGQAHEITIFEYWLTDLQLMKLPADNFTKSRLTGYTNESTYDPNYIEPKSDPLPLGSIPPDWKLPLVSGDSLQLSSLKGKVVMLDFWDKNNTACIFQMQYLQSLQNKYSKNKVVFVGIDCTDDFTKANIALFLKKRNISMMSIFNERDLGFYYHVRYSPTLFIIGKDGKVMYTQEGYEEKGRQEIRDMVDKALLMPI